MAIPDEIHVLLVASDPLSVALVGEAFEEMAELRFRRGWRNCRAVESGSGLGGAAGLSSLGNGGTVHTGSHPGRI